MALHSVFCEKGHFVQYQGGRDSERPAKFCKQCGSPTIDRCPNCNAIFDDEEKPAPHCDQCGKPLPWTKGKS